MFTAPRSFSPQPISRPLVPSPCPSRCPGYQPSLRYSHTARTGHLYLARKGTSLLSLDNKVTRVATQLVLTAHSARPHLHGEGVRCTCTLRDAWMSSAGRGGRHRVRPWSGGRGARRNCHGGAPAAISAAWLRRTDVCTSEVSRRSLSGRRVGRGEAASPAVLHRSGWRRGPTECSQHAGGDGSSNAGARDGRVGIVRDGRAGWDMGD